MTKIYRIFGIKVLEVEIGEKEEPKGFKFKKPQGACLDYTPEDEEKDKVIEKYGNTN